jgi:hypothetical protein
MKLRIKEIKNEKWLCKGCGKIHTEGIVIFIGKEITFFLCHPCKEYLHYALIT